MSVFTFGKSYKPEGDFALLTTVYDFGSRAITESLLREAEIPYIIKERGGSVPVITGSSLYGTDIFVRNADLDTAAGLIAPILTGDGDVPAEESEDDGESDGK